jgi:hypothetical protein|uniref:Tail protein n=1 Tax=viral metagenome TaxID=1070528 RepID=A0A6C0IWJ3_9ZZZZ
MASIYGLKSKMDSLQIHRDQIMAFEARSRDPRSSSIPSYAKTHTIILDTSNCTFDDGKVEAMVVDGTQTTTGLPVKSVVIPDTEHVAKFIIYGFAIAREYGGSKAYDITSTDVHGYLSVDGSVEKYPSFLFKASTGYSSAWTYLTPIKSTYMLPTLRPVRSSIGIQLKTATKTINFPATQYICSGVSIGSADVTLTIPTTEDLTTSDIVTIKELGLFKTPVTDALVSGTFKVANPTGIIRFIADFKDTYTITFEVNGIYRPVAQTYTVTVTELRYNGGTETLTFESTTVISPAPALTDTITVDEYSLSGSSITDVITTKKFCVDNGGPSISSVPTTITVEAESRASHIPIDVVTMTSDLTHLELATI